MMIVSGDSEAWYPGLAPQQTGPHAAAGPDQPGQGGVAGGGRGGQVVRGWSDRVQRAARHHSQVSDEQNSGIIQIYLFI